MYVMARNPLPVWPPQKDWSWGRTEVVGGFTLRKFGTERGDSVCHDPRLHIGGFMRLPNLVVAVAVVCSMALTLLAQVSTIEGDVKGPDGSRAVGAVVKITRTDIKANYSVRTNKDGHYAFNSLPSGVYNINVKWKGI